MKSKPILKTLNALSLSSPVTAMSPIRNPTSIVQ